MLKLHCLDNTELSSYCINILEKHGITMVREFNSEKPEKLMKILNLNFEQVKKIKEEYRRLYGLKHYMGSILFKEEQRKKKMYSSHIKSLDNMLAPYELFNSLSFWEICGPTGVGKTQLAYTLMLNFIINQVAPALYIDTKLDFSASRIKNMLTARKIKSDEYAGIMSFIIVERVLSAQGLVEMLEEFYNKLQQGNKDVALIKMIVIDSLPSLWFLLKAESNRLYGKWILSRLSQIIKRLVQQCHIAVVCINLSLIPSPEENEIKLHASYDENDISDLIEADDMELNCESSCTLAASYQPVLGNFWLSKPNTRLSLEFCDADNTCNENNTRRVIKLIYTRFFPIGLSCLVRLQPEGFV